MPITCQICNRQFDKIISSTHLRSHGTTSAEYKLRYGKGSLASLEYREIRSRANSGEKNPNFGNKMSEESRQEISKANKGKPAWNKGTTLDDTTVYSAAASRREAKYANGELTRVVRKAFSQADREYASRKTRDYAKLHPEEIRERARKAVMTKRNTGFYERKRAATEAHFRERCKTHGFTVDEIDNNIATVVCDKCDTVHTRSISSAVHNNMCPTCSSIGVSSYEAELIGYLKTITSHNIVASDRTVLGNLELDVYIPDLSIAFEINGLYWHSEEMGKSTYYHRYKTDRCKEKGIQLIHIFEDEWVHKRTICESRIKSKLGLNTTTYARNYLIKEIPHRDAYDFLTEHHIQGRGTQSMYSYGLYDKSDKLTAVMTFSKLSIAKGATHTEGYYELNRYSSIGNIVGGASRLFKYFINAIDPERVISYSDSRWNTGNLYRSLGFEYAGETTPGYWYTRGTERIHRFKLRKTKDDPADKTEKVLRREQGYYRIWDCGNSKWIWNKS